MWWTLYDTTTGALRGHTSVQPTNPDPAWTVISHASRQDQGNVWNPTTKAWVARPPEPPGPAIDTFTLNGIQPATWTNMPAAKTALPGSEQKLPLHDAQHARLQTNVRVVGVNGSVLIVQVSLDGITYVDGPSVPINVLGLQVSTLVPIPEQFRTDVWVRIAGQGGNGAADPQLGLTTLQIRMRARRVILAAFLLTLVLLPGANADHIDEPQSPITGAYVEVLHYSNPQYIVPCGETSFEDPYPFPFVGARIRLFIDSDLARPSEHFLTRLKVERGSKTKGGTGGGFAWEAQWAVDWKHANVPPHTNMTPELREPGGGGMWLHTGDRTNTWYRVPGLYRVRAEITADETGGFFVAECFVQVPEGGAP